MFKRMLVISLLIFTVVFFFFFKAVYQVRQARFNVDALDRFLRSYEQVAGERIENIADLPDFHLISKSEGLQLKDDDLKKGIYEGYVYDLSGVGTEDYVLSASPVRSRAPNMEFAALGDGNLYFNKKNPDVTAETAQEVRAWKVIRRVRVRTKESPEYMSWH